MKTIGIRTSDIVTSSEYMIGPAYSKIKWERKWIEKSRTHIYENPSSGNFSREINMANAMANRENDYERTGGQRVTRTSKQSRKKGPISGHSVILESGRKPFLRKSQCCCEQPGWTTFNSPLDLLYVVYCLGQCLLVWGREEDSSLQRSLRDCSWRDFKIRQ